MSIYQHFREDERPFVDQVLGWQMEVKDRHQERLTDFLDPRQLNIMRTIIGANDETNLHVSGGSPAAERVRALLVPSYIQIAEEDFQLVLFSIEYSAKFSTLKHREILGALMNLGIKRDKFGDIFINDSNAQIIVAEEIADFIKFNLEKIGRTSVSLRKMPLENALPPEEDWKEGMTTVSSMRLDVVLSQIYNISRTKALPYIEKGLVKVNWKQTEKPDLLLGDGDYLSMRGYGRAHLLETLGFTKKEKIRLKYRKLS